MVRLIVWFNMAVLAQFNTLQNKSMSELYNKESPHTSASPSVPQINTFVRDLTRFKSRVYSAPMNHRTIFNLNHPRWWHLMMTCTTFSNVMVYLIRWGTSRDNDGVLTEYSSFTSLLPIRNSFQMISQVSGTFDFVLKWTEFYQRSISPRIKCLQITLFGRKKETFITSRGESWDHFEDDIWESTIRLHSGQCLIETDDWYSEAWQW
jgi:hypothetical protein